MKAFQVALKGFDKERYGAKANGRCQWRWNKKQRGIRRGKEKLMKKKMEGLKVEMMERSKEQENIRIGQKEVKEKLEMLELECEELRRETDSITQQSFNTQLRLCLMFQILQARQVNDFNKAAAFTHILREVIAESKGN